MARARDSRGRFTSGDGDPLQGLAADAQDAAKALGDLSKAAGAAQAPLKKAGDEAASAAKVVGDKLKDAAREALGFEKASKEAGAATNTFATALASLASGALEQAVSGLEEFARNLPEAAARSEAHEAALQRLGGAYEAVRHATNGAVSAEQAAAVQQRALQSGLRLSAQELAAVTSRARDFARTTGTDLDQALEQLTDQLVDPGEELRKFGVFLQTGMNAGDALRETLRQLGAQAQATGASQVTLAESMEMASRAGREAGDALAGMIAQRLELRDFFTQLTSWIDDAKASTDGWGTAVDTLTGTLREMIGLQGRASGQANQSASGAFTGEAGALMAQARARGLNFGGLQVGRMGVDATPEQRSRLLALMRRAAMGQVNQQTLDVEVQGFDAEVGLVADDRRRTEAAAAAAAARARQQEITRRNRASSSPTSASTTQLPSGFGVGTEGFLADFIANVAVQARSRIAAMRTAPTRPESFVSAPTLGERVDANDARRESALARLGVDAANAPTGGAPFSDRARASAEAETRQRVERTRILREQNTALRDLVSAAEREADVAMRHNRPMAEVNEIIQRRIGLQTALAQNTRDLTAAQQENAISFEEVGSKVVGVLEQTTDAFGEGVVAAIEGSAGFVKSVEAMAYGTVRAIAKMAVIEVIKEGAMALAAIATYRYDAAAAHGASAAMWAGIGLVSGGLLAAMPNPNAAKPAAAAGGGGTATRSADTGRSARVDDKANSGPLSLTINVSGAAFTDAGVQQAVSSSLRDAVGNGYITRAHLAPLLGN